MLMLTQPQHAFARVKPTDHGPATTRTSSHRRTLAVVARSAERCSQQAVSQLDGTFLLLKEEQLNAFSALKLDFDFLAL